MRARTWMAGLAAAALAAAGLVGAGTAADAAITTQPAGVSVTVDASGSNTALVSSPTVANLTVKNNSTSASLGVFTIVVPAGVSPVQAVGVQGPGNWRQTVLPCGTTANCSALVLVYASLPLSTSVLKPGQSVTSSVRFTTPAAPTSLAFKFLGIGNGLFTTTDTPTINVIQGVAGSFCVTPPGNLVAGATATFTVQAISDGSECGNVTSKKIGIAATSLNIKFNTDDSQGGIAAGIVGGPLTGGTNVTLPLTASASGLYTFTGTFTAAGTQSIRVATATAGGNSTGFAVSPAAAKTVEILKVAPKGATALAAGSVFTTTYQVKDEFGNVIPTPYNEVTIGVTGGTFTPTGTGSNPVAGGLNVTPADGTVDGTFVGASGLQTLTATVGAASSTAEVSFAAASTGSAVLFPGSSATIVTTGFSGGTNPTCVGTTTCAGLSLGEGGSGPATFGIDTCTAAAIPVDCPSDSGAIVANLTADLKDKDGVSLYGQGNTPDQAQPAHMTYVCPLARCGHSDGMDEYKSDRNRYAESVEDFNFHPFKYVLSTDTVGTPVHTAVDCSAGLTHIAYEEGDENELVDPGTDTTIPGTPGEFHTCIDVHNLVRNTGGDLIFEVYFYDDYKGFVP